MSSKFEKIVLQKFEELNNKLDYTNNNVAKILEEQIKMREEMKEYNLKCKIL